MDPATAVDRCVADASARKHKNPLSDGERKEPLGPGLGMVELEDCDDTGFPRCAIVTDLASCQSTVPFGAAIEDNNKEKPPCRKGRAYKTRF